MTAEHAVEQRQVMAPKRGELPVARTCLPGQRVRFRIATECVALIGEVQRQSKLDTELDRLAPGPRTSPRLA